MKRLGFAVALAFAGTALGCSDGMMSPMGPTGMDMMGSRAVFPTNGETIFRTGRNQQGVILQDLARSQMPMPHSCASCHGSDGAGSMMGGSDPHLHPVPYTEETLTRFLDDEVKPDGTVANTGVAWRMSAQDKADVIAFLKTL